jgi:hypothetical protein
MSFGLPINHCSDADAWLGALFRGCGAELIDVEATSLSIPNRFGRCSRPAIMPFGIRSAGSTEAM